MPTAAPIQKTCVELRDDERHNLLLGKEGFDERVWLKTDDEDDWVLAASLSAVGDKASGGVRVVRLHAPLQHNLREVIKDTTFAKMEVVKGDWLQAVDDLVLLAEEKLSDAPVLHTLRQRYHREDAIFTAIGDVLVAINPFRPVACCSDTTINNLMKMELEFVPPHIVRIARAAYVGMTAEVAAQSILVSGESGAGKTETAKLCLRCIAAASNSSGRAIDAALASSPVLEAFGNATTIHNKNSSRFGKWLTLYFDSKGRVLSCNIKHFLLEQSRVSAPPPAERNFHVFYYLLASKDEASKDEASKDEASKGGSGKGGSGKGGSGGLGGGPAAYTYTKPRQRVDGGKADKVLMPTDDSAAWVELSRCMSDLGFDEQLSDICRYLAAVLALGNAPFAESLTAGGAAARPADDGAAIGVASELLRVDGAALLEKITTRRVVAGGDVITLNHSASQSADARDALARAAYAKLFAWVVDQINGALAAQIKPGEVLDDERTIGLLDIFGFENFRLNGFEQLCINLTNERLQSIFMEALVKRQLAEYQREGITYAHISYPDNVAQLTLLDAKAGSIMSMLDEECRVPNGAEAAYVRKMHDRFARSAVYSPPMRGAAAVGTELDDRSMDELQFVVNHYAGPVRYTALNWLEKNRGKLPAELSSVLSASRCPLTVALFPAHEGGVPVDQLNTGAAETMPSASRSMTVGGTFRSSLRQLAATILQSTQHFVRCIKPNPAQTPSLFDGAYVSRQLAHAGIRSVIDIHQRGYPVSFPQHDFIRRYRCLSFDQPAKLSKELPPATICTNLLTIAEGGADGAARWLSDMEAQIGHTKVFMRGPVRRVLETLRTRAFSRAAICVQRHTKARIDYHVALFLAPQDALLSDARAAIASHDPEPAVEALDEVTLMWAKAVWPIGLHPMLRVCRADVDELELALIALQRGLAVESAAVEEILASCAYASECDSPREAFLNLKVALISAKGAARGLVEGLRPAIVEAESLLETKFSALVEEWEAEARRRIEEKEESRRAKQQAAEVALRVDPQMEILTIELRRSPSAAVPASGLVRVAEQSGAEGNVAHGVHFSESNAIARIDGSSPNAPKHGGAKDGAPRLRVGDVAVALSDAPLNGRRVQDVLTIADKLDSAAQLTLTIARPKYARLDAASLPSGEMTGWVYANLAFDKGHKPVGNPRAGRYWAALQGDVLLLVSPREGGAALGDVSPASLHSIGIGGGGVGGGRVGGRLSSLGTVKKRISVVASKDKAAEAESAGVTHVLGVNSASGERVIRLQGATAKTLLTKSLTLGKGGEAIRLPGVAQALVDRRLFPLRLGWPDGETEHIELVMAFPSSAERGAWQKALTTAIKLVKVEEATAGWLLKRGGRRRSSTQGSLKSLLSSVTASWKRRWMVLLPSGEDPHERVIEYSEAPEAKAIKGQIMINKGTRMIHSELLYPDQPYCFTLTSLAPGEPRPITTVLTATSAEELEKWWVAVDDAVRGCIYADFGVTMRTPAMRRDEAELMSKTVSELNALLRYLNAPIDRKVTDRGILAARIVAQRLHLLAGGGVGAGAQASREKATRDVMRARAEKARREEVRLMGKTLEELHALLAFLEVEGVDPAIESKKTLVGLIVGEKNLSRMTQRHAPELQSWRIRSVSNAHTVDARAYAISLTERPALVTTTC